MVREAAKKVLPLMAGPLRPNPPPPSGLMADGTFLLSFFLNGPALYPPPS